MSRQYTEAEKLHALDQVEANGGNLAQTAAQIGISDRTLARWRRHYHSTSTTFPPKNVVAPTVSDDDLDALRDLKREMMANAYHLNNSIPDAIPEAPLPHRMAALAQIIDRIIKLSTQLAAEEEEEAIYRIAGSEGQEPDEETEEDRAY